MRRALFMVLLLVPAVSAQDAEEALREALNPSTAPTRRIQLMKQLVATPEGEAALAARALDPARDEEVVHAAVAVLCEAGKAEPYIERISLLLLTDDESLNEKVRERIKRYVTDPGKAVALVERVEPIARGTTANSSKGPRGRVAAVRVLREIPHREAVALIVDVWEADGDATVREECGLALEWLAQTPQQARAELRRLEPYETLHDLMKSRLETLLKERDKYRRYQVELLKTADATRSFEAMNNGDEEAKLVASGRLREIAAKGEFGRVGAEDFAKRALQTFVRERDQRERRPETLAHLVRALVELTKGDKPPLWAAVGKADLAQALQPLAEAPAGWDQVGKACVSLLNIIEGDAASTLKAFARTFRSQEVRREAVLSLGALARSRDDLRDYVGLTLSGLLESEKVPSVRKSILFQLTSAPHADAIDPIRGFLFPGDPLDDPRLSRTEFLQCFKILREIGSEKALGTLMDAAASHADPAVRLLAVSDGLLARSGKPDEEQRILDHLKGIVLDGEQPAEVRLGVVRELGEKGGRSAHATLEDLSKTKGQLDPALQRTVGEAKLRLGERLVGRSNGEAITRKDIETIVRVLEDLEATGDPARLEKLARDVVAKAAERKLPAGNARYLRARLHARLEGAKPEDTLRLYREAVEAAETDHLTPPVETALRQEYGKRLEESAADPARGREAIRNLERLAALAEGEPRRAVGHLLEAAECAVHELKSRAETERILKEIEKRAARPKEDVAQRIAKIREALEALPRPQ